MSNLGGNFLEDFQYGDIIHHAIPRSITSGDASMFLGLTGTRYPLFCAKNFANSLGLIQHQLMTFFYLISLLEELFRIFP